MAEAHHGNTPAAWTAVCVALVAFVVGAIGLVVGNWPTFWVGVGLLAVAALVGKVMQAMGLGDTPEAASESVPETAPETASETTER